MQILSVCGIAVAAAVISLLVKQYKPEYSPAVAAVASVTVLTAALKAAIPIAAEYFGRYERLRYYVQEPRYNIPYGFCR